MKALFVTTYTAYTALRTGKGIMEMNVKKMVAREVLILLCLFIVIGACGYAVSTLPSKCQGVFQVKYNKRIHQITSYDYNLFEVKNRQENKARIIAFLKGTGLKDPVDPLASLEVKTIGQKCPEGKKWRDVASLIFLIAIGAYPIYWLIRLTLWVLKKSRKQ